MSDDIEYPPSLNRVALTVTAKPAFLDWLRTLPEGESLTLDRVNLECTVYLVPEDEDDPAVLVEDHFERIFEQELLAWCTDSDLWPENLDYESFLRYFDVRVGSTVFDLGQDDLEVYE